MQIKESHAPLTELASQVWAMQMKYQWNITTHSSDDKSLKKKKAVISVASRENGVAVQKIVFLYEWKYELLSHFWKVIL